MDSDDELEGQAEEPDTELTPVEQRLFAMVEAYHRKYGRPPAYREIAAHVQGISSLSQIRPLLKHLEELRLLNHTGGIARGTVPVRTPISIKGRIAAGEPLEIWDEGGWQEMDIELLGVSSAIRAELYALQVKGDSMIEDGILHGDWLIVRAGTSAPNGAIVIAVERRAGQHGAATVKRFYKRDSDAQIRLLPANPAHAPRVIAGEVWDRDWEIQGTVIATYRSY